MTQRDITPSNFDLIVVGTGLQESLLAAGAARAGKKVLHIDTADFYGSHWASHQLGYFEKWCRMHASSAGPLYSNAEVYKGRLADLGPSNEYNIDLAPKLVYSTGRLIDALLGGAAQNYLDFKLLQQSYVWRDGQYWQVPASKAAVFKHSALNRTEKRQLMRFLQQHVMAPQNEHEDDDMAFIEVLQEEQLTPQLQEAILYALAFADRSGGAMTYAQGMEALAQYKRSAGRYGEGTGAFLLPVYGGGELPQAFCRVAAVADALYVLRQGIEKFVMDADTGLCRALRTSSGQELTASAFAGNPETLSQFCRAEAHAAPQRGLSRAVLILDAPLVKDKLQVDETTLKKNPDEIAQVHVLVMLPPGVAGNAHPVRALQLGAATACAPRDKYIVHLSTLQTAATAREDFYQAAQSLADLSSLQASSSTAETAEATGGDDGHNDGAAGAQAVAANAAPKHAVQENEACDASEACSKPRALFLAYYNQALPEDSQSSWDLPHNVALCSMPSPSVAQEDAVLEAEILLNQLFPDLEGLFTGQAPAMDDTSDDDANEAMSEALGAAGVPYGGEADEH